jgi:hypothetical protein
MLQPAKTLKTPLQTEASEVVPRPPHPDLAGARPAAHARVTGSEPVSPIEALLRELVTEVKGLRADLTRDGRRSHLTRADRDRLAQILPAIAGALGSEPFASRDLSDASPGLRVVLRGLSVKQIGRLLSRAEGVPIDGWLVERCGIEINVALWRVVATVSHRLESGIGLARSGSISAGEPDV